VSDFDAELIGRARSGDRRAFDELYRRHVDLVHRRVSRLVGPDSEREDLVQQVFLSAFRALPAFRGDATFSTWLYPIIVNTAYEHLRRRKRRPATSVLPEELHQVASPNGSPEALLREREQIQRVMRLLERVKPKKRVAFVLRVVEGLPIEEIATIVKASPAAVGQRIKHAHRELARMIEKEEHRHAMGVS
jgi:RNA polymerase sigma-70 factor (ECF subfamily)